MSCVISGGAWGGKTPDAGAADGDSGTEESPGAPDRQESILHGGGIPSPGKGNHPFMTGGPDVTFNGKTDRHHFFSVRDERLCGRFFFRGNQTDS
jgi:hypothetical protein